VSGRCGPDGSKSRSRQVYNNAYVPLQSQAKKMVTSSDSREDDYVGALIYRESQLRKTEAAAAAESHRIQLGRDQPVKQDSISLLTMIQMSLET